MKCDVSSLCRADTLLRTVSDFLAHYPMYLNIIKGKKLFQNSLHIERCKVIFNEQFIAHTDNNTRYQIYVLIIIVPQQHLVRHSIHILLHREQIIIVICNEPFDEVHEAAGLFIFKYHK